MAQNPISTPLPADLPVNWTEGQTVAPNGPDVGLSQQHGYNYQSQQINSAQSAINTIGSAFSNLYGNTDIVPVVNGGTGGETADEARANLGAAGNKNHLTNWDFRNPVNQRGQTSYTGAVYGLDMWKSSVSSTVLSIVSGGIKISSGGTAVQTLQFTPDNGMQVTLSAKINGEIISHTFIWDQSSTYIASGTFPNGFRLAVSGTVNYVQLYNVSGSADAVIESAKLELGPVSTLQNDPPQDYGEELRKCQRYQWVTPYRPEWIRAAKVVSGSIYFEVATPATFRVNPTINTSLPEARLTITDFGTSTAASGFTYSAMSTGYGVRIAANKENHGLKDATLELMRVLFDANL